MSSFQKQVSFLSNNPPQNQSSILRLSQKIFDINKSHKNNQVVSDYSQLQNKVYDLQNKLLQAVKFVSNTIKSYRQNLIEKNQKLVQNESRSHISKKIRKNQIKQLSQRIRSWMQTQKKNRITIQEKFICCFQQKMQTFTLQLAKQIDNRKLYLNILDSKLQENLPELKQEISKQLQTQALMIQQINKRLELQISQFKRILKEKDNELNKQTKKIMDLLGQTVNQIKCEIENQKRQRQMKKEQIMELFEGAYKKLMF